jgi:hypothetical protein
MPTLKEFFSTVTTIHTSPGGPLVEQTIAAELKAGWAPRATVGTGGPLPTTGVRLAVSTGAAPEHPALRGPNGWGILRLLPGGGIEILASAPHLLFRTWSSAIEEWIDLPVEEFRQGKTITPAFPRIRPSYDSFLTMHNRTLRDFDREEHIRNLARLGFSHAEVNGLAFAVPFERGPVGEVLHRFYTYCPALDQFVTSSLNRGYYDRDYLQANLNFLKGNAALAEKYGLSAGMTCFEPRSVPDALLERYPMLRGARVDHPIRSWHPRYNLSIAHPVVREHYAEMMENLVREVPLLDFIAIWSNDSGAGFEYTSSLYVGRNGGGYVIREWKGDSEIAESAANNLIRFHRVLRDAGRKVNPKFRTLLRLEAFVAEHKYLWAQLEDGIDVETGSLVSRGWEVEYKHPRYPERKATLGTALFNGFDPAEKTVMDQIRTKGAETDVYFSGGSVWNHEPLLGVPFPRLVHDKLVAMARQSVSTLAYTGGTTPRSLTPYNINEELLRAFQVDPGLSYDRFVAAKAEEWIGPELAPELVQLWHLSDDAYRAFPVPVQIYSGWGVWYRLFVRPIVPDIEKISEEDRRYYEEFLLAPPHNRCRIDFRYDVGFDLIQPDDAMRCLSMINDNVMPVMQKAHDRSAALLARARGGKGEAVAQDLHDRYVAMLCWYRNQRNVTAWIAGVHNYLESSDAAMKKKCREILRQMVLDEIENTKVLLAHAETARTPWMIFSDVGETTFIYYHGNFADQLRRKIALMQGHENDEPYVDPDFQWRVPGLTAPPKR